MEPMCVMLSSVRVRRPPLRRIGLSRVVCVLAGSLEFDLSSASACSIVTGTLAAAAAFVVAIDSIESLNLKS